MDQVKSWFTSKTIWMAVLGALVSVLKAFNVHVAFLEGLDVNAFAGHMADYATTAFALLAGLFRLTAKHKLT